ncbi:hypothetical protein CS369_10015 [Candidatus Symbiopectobacterium sp. 'North America']|uniref:hypothetical protein n=1 Tax=Candidatus Symbiopectobacterium sp. 'North America' TaxID=2794574 RepID=UPI0018C9313D|nr:hypothetical protein [Candidatus Symbiopectobacterium sp. 'North America']MBG6245017.1 hypothetical protein [Candidatus Symbiopectobacterium sp. 'North America']
MSVIRTCLNLFGGDTVIVRCFNTFDIHMSDSTPELQTTPEVMQNNSISISAEDEVYFTVPYTGEWNLTIYAKNDTPEHSISYFLA